MNLNIKNKLKKIKNMLSKKIPTPYPVFEGNLLIGRTALITGGGSGIGYSIAESFLKNGASVIITGRNYEKLKKAASCLEKYVTNKQFIKCFVLDISKTDSIKSNIDKILSDPEIKKIDILVNNAGIQSKNDIGNVDIDDFRTVFSTNVEGTYFMSQVIYNYMKKSKIKGNILNVASSSSKRPAISPYSVSKWSIAGLTLGMAKKFIKDGIVVNGIAPGPTATPMLLDNPKNGIEKYNSPINRFIMPEEIANISTILVSDLGKAIIGDIIYVTGGSAIITFDDIDY